MEHMLWCWWARPECSVWGRLWAVASPLSFWSLWHQQGSAHGGPWPAPALRSLAWALSKGALKNIGAVPFQLWPPPRCASLCVKGDGSP